MLSQCQNLLVLILALSLVRGFVLFSDGFSHDPRLSACFPRLLGRLPLPLKLVFKGMFLSWQGKREGARWRSGA